VLLTAAGVVLLVAGAALATVLWAGGGRITGSAQGANPPTFKFLSGGGNIGAWGPTGVANDPRCVASVTNEVLTLTITNLWPDQSCKFAAVLSIVTNGHQPIYQGVVLPEEAEAAFTVTNLTGSTPTGLPSGNLLNVGETITGGGANRAIGFTLTATDQLAPGATIDLTGTVAKFEVRGA
jgi:hypothetical protein